MRRWKRKQALIVVQTASQKAVGQAMVSVATMLVDKKIVAKDEPTAVPKLVSDIWGRGVLAFEFSFGKTALKKSELKPLRVQINQLIEGYAKSQGLSSKYEYPVFYVTDIWLYHEELHVDVANVVNEPTREYIEDLKKVE
ncbi:hypothetical protein ACLJJ6_03870 [Pediococcus siamensis]|uniref:hypothetical protein n=1 Tax=Pediococcus siamensis TaxID=381829 RepID=UPI0039A2C35D